MRTTQTTFYAMLCVYMFFSDLLASIQPFVQQKMVTSLYSYFSYIYNLMLDFMYLHNRKKKTNYDTKRNTLWLEQISGNSKAHRQY